jgi:S1-C subfamily serine protease
MISLFNRTAYTKVLAFLLILSLCLGNLSVFAESTSIKDLDKSSSYARDAITELSSKGIITGDSKGNFNPGQNITRAQMIAIITRVLALDIKDLPDKATFRDVPKNHWAFPYVETAYKEGIVTGASKDTFSVNDPCTREQMTAMFVRALGITEDAINNAFGSESISKLSDKNRISGWSKSYVEFALSTGLMTGTSSKTFGPKEYAKREQAAVVTNRFITNKEDIVSLPSNGKELTIKEIAALDKSVVLIETYDKNGAPFAQGSGFCIAKGLFLTNYHVLEGSSKYTIKDSSGKSYEVQGIVKYDADLDLAIIKTKEPTSIAPLPIGSKNNIEKADRIAAIGNPQGLQNTISEGIVSGIRKFEYGDTGSIDIIQITAPISHGSSGGALFDMKGNVIGVTSSMSEDGNLKFAVAIDHAKGWIQELKSKPFESIAVLDMSKSIKAYLDVSDESIKTVVYNAFRAMEEENIEAYISTIHKFSPAYKAIWEEYKKVFMSYEFDYDILELKILEKADNAAKVDIIYTIKNTEDPQDWDTHRVFGQYSLSKENGEWKIYYATETMESYPKDYPQNTGIGGFSKEEAEEAYKAYLAQHESDPVQVNGIPLNFKVADSVMHPSKPIIYMSDIYNQKLYSYNYETKETKETAFNFSPESIAFAGDEIYVALLKEKHSPYWYVDKQRGAIAVIDTESFKLKEQFDIDIDPFDIVIGRDDHIYVTSGSGQHTKFKSYSRKTKQEVSSSGINGEAYAVLHPKKDIIYTSQNTSPSDIVMYKTSDGKFTDPVYPGGIDTFYHGEYEMGRKLIFSPDGNDLLTSAGTIFTSSQGNAVYHSKLGRSYIDAAFDTNGTRFFTGITGGFIYEYAYPSFKPTSTYKVQGEIVNLYYRSNELLAVTKVDNKYYIEEVQLNK